MIKAVETMYKQEVSKNQKLGSDLLPDFAEEAPENWLKMTIEAFSRIVKEKFEALREI